MYYRVAIQRQGDQLDRPPSWQWKSTVLSSLQTLFQFLRLYGALPQDQLLVFFSSSGEGLVEQLAQENRGHESDSVTAAQFLRERMICSPQVARRTSEREGGSYQERVSTAVATQPSLNESCKGFTTLDRGGLSALERRRLELESGAGGDHDLPYWFTGPSSLPQALAWMKLLVRVQDGEWHP
jgi:hypothetical protein